MDIQFITLHWYPPKTVRETICKHSTLNTFVSKFTFLMTSFFFYTTVPCTFIIHSKNADTPPGREVKSSIHYKEGYL